MKVSSGSARFFFRVFFMSLAFMFVEYLILTGFAPFGMTVRYSTSDRSPGISLSGPEDRVRTGAIGGSQVFMQEDDIAYFATDMPHEFDLATVRITFQNLSPDQDLYVGYRDRDDWHYRDFLYDAPVLDALSWYRTGKGPVLYQKTYRFGSVKEFLEAAPQDQVIGLYNADASGMRQMEYRGDPGGQSAEETLIDTPLRGRHVMYAYVRDEPFRLTVSKQDLNWYEGDDPVTVDVFKEGDLVFRAVIPDDGVTDDSHAVLPPEESRIENPGPGLPEPGIYRIVLGASGDSVIRSVSTNLDKVVFAGPVLPVSNAEVYPGIVATTSATVLFTDSRYVTAMTPHEEATQSASVDGAALPLLLPHETVATESQSPVSRITLPESDAAINGIPGYFSFSPEALFRPFLLNTLTVSGPADIGRVGYVYADYTPGRLDGGYRIWEKTITIGDAALKDGKLSWILRAPGLRESGRTVIIRRIDVVFSKKPALRFGGSLWN